MKSNGDFCWFQRGGVSFPSIFERKEEKKVSVGGEMFEIFSISCKLK